MFESNLLSQINTSSPLPTVVEVQFSTSISNSLHKAFQFAHTCLAEKSDRAASLLPWTDELYLVASGLLERLLLQHADTTFAEMIFALRRAELDGPLVSAPSLASRSSSLWMRSAGRYLRWLLLGPSPVMTPEERAIRFINEGASSQLRLPSAAPAEVVLSSRDVPTVSPLVNDITTDDIGMMGGTSNGAALAQLNSAELLKAEHAPYGYLRFKPLSNRGKTISLFLSTLKPYLERKAEQWYVRNTDVSVDAVAMRDAYAHRYPQRAALLRFLAQYVYPIYHVLKQGSRFLFLMCYLLEMTPYISGLHRVFGIILRRSTAEDALTSSPREQRVLLVARVVLLFIFFGFRLLDFTRNTEGAASPRTLRDEGLPIPPPPALGTDVPLPEDRSSLPKPGECPVCHKQVTNAAVCLVSGAVGCYPCLQEYVREHQECPMTHCAMGVEQLRRIFEG